MIGSERTEYGTPWIKARLARSAERSRAEDQIEDSRGQTKKAAGAPPPSRNIRRIQPRSGLDSFLLYPHLPDKSSSRSRFGACALIRVLAAFQHRQLCCGALLTAQQGACRMRPAHPITARLSRTGLATCDESGLYPKRTRMIVLDDHASSSFFLLCWRSS